MERSDHSICQECGGPKSTWAQLCGKTQCLGSNSSSSNHASQEPSSDGEQSTKRSKWEDQLYEEPKEISDLGQDTLRQILKLLGKTWSPHLSLVCRAWWLESRNFPRRLNITPAQLLEPCQFIQTQVAPLEVNATRVNKAAVETFTKLLKELKQLKKLYLRFHAFDHTSEVMRGLWYALSDTTRITELDTNGNGLGLGEAWMFSLCDVLPKTKIHTLRLIWSTIGPEGAAKLAAALSTTPSLTSLNLAWNQIGAGGAATLARVLSASRLTELDVSGNDIGAGGAARLAAVLPTTNIASLYIGSNSIDDEGASAVAAALSATPSLTSISLASNEIGAEGAKALAAALSTTPNLTSLVLEGNNIGAEGAKALAVALPASRLTNLDLALNNVGDWGTEHVAVGLKHNCTLEVLRLDCNNIYDIGALALAAVLSTSSLTDLNMGHNNIGDHGRYKLKAALTTTPLVHLNLEGNKGVFSI